MPRWPERTLQERFEQFVSPEPNTGCWLWTGGYSANGYGRFNQTQAHRFSWELVHGPIPDGLQACHKCDVRACVNPEHIFIGTQSDNLRDMVQKGRDNPRRGEQHGRTKLTEEDVVKIRADTRSLRVIGKEYGFDKSHVWKIKRGWYWARNSALRDNDAERQHRGKMIRARGETHHKAKLTEIDVRAVLTDSRSAYSLARVYGVSKHTVLMIRHRKIWKHVSCA
jgi:HNH endonuclease